MKLYIFFSLLVFSSSTFAVSHVRDAKITTLYCGYFSGSEMCSITFDKPFLAKDSCHTNPTERMQFKVDNAIGKALLSLALSAKATQENVDVYGTGTCNVYPTFSDVNWIEIKD